MLPDKYPAFAFDVKNETSIAYAWVSSRISEYLLSVFGESDGLRQLQLITHSNIQNQLLRILRG